MKITIMGHSDDGRNKEAELTMEYLGGTDWRLAVGKIEFNSSDLEDTMVFLKDRFNKGK